MKNCIPSLAGLIIFSLAQAVHADGDKVSSQTIVSGFGTLGAVYNSNENHGFLRDVGQETALGRQYSWRTDTRLGVQLAHLFNPQWQVVGQLVLRDQARNTLNNSITRAFVAYRPTANLHLRLGRMADATFLMSDYLDVGYAYPWVRPPVESYGLIAPRFYDGVDVTYSIPSDGGIWRVKGLYGNVQAAIPTASGTHFMLDSNDLKGLALIREQGPLKVRIGYSTFHLAKEWSPPSQLLPGLKQLSANPLVNAFYPAIANEARSRLDDLSGMQGARVGYASAGLIYDDGRWLAQVEVSRLSAQTKLAPVGEQGFASLGYRLGDFLPYVTVSGARASALAKAGASWAVLGADAARLQQGALIPINASRMAQSTLSLGVRWDFHSQAALKLQWDHVRVRHSGWRIWTSPISDEGAADRANLLSATLDFVF